MIPQADSPQRSDVAAPDRGSFWAAALLGVPAANVALLSAVVFLDEDLFLPAAALVALGELALLIPWTRTYGIGVLGALATWLGNAAITVLGLIVAFLVAFSIACEPGCLS